MPKVPPLTETQIKKLAETLTRWASVHPRPDEPLDYGYSPRQIAKGMANPDPNAVQSFYRFFSTGIMMDPYDPRPQTLDQILAFYKREANGWAAEKKPVKPKLPRPPRP